MQEDGLHVGDDVVLREALKERTVRDLNVHDAQAKRIFSVRADGVVGVEHALDRAVADGVHGDLAAVFDRKAHHFGDLIGRERGDARRRGIIVVRPAHERGARAEAAVDEHLEGPDLVPGVALPRCVPLPEEAPEAFGLHEVHLMVDAHGGVFRLHGLVGRKRLLPARRTKVHRLHGGDAVFRRMRHGGADDVLDLGARAALAKREDLGAGVFAHDARQLPGLVEVVGAAAGATLVFVMPASSRAAVLQVRMWPQARSRMRGYSVVTASRSRRVSRRLPSSWK